MAQENLMIAVDGIVERMRQFEIQYCIYLDRSRKRRPVFSPGRRGELESRRELNKARKWLASRERKKKFKLR